MRLIEQTNVTSWVSRQEHPRHEPLAGNNDALILFQTSEDFVYLIGREGPHASGADVALRPHA